MACVCSRYNARSDCLIVTECRVLFSRNAHGPITGLQKTKQKVIKKAYNEQLTNLTCSGPYWGILALGRFCTDLAALGPYCHVLGPIFPSTALALG